MFNYVYKITNLKENKFYIGVRKSKINPILDLGIKYFSSSKDLIFIKDQKENPQNYKYEIVKLCKNRKEAISLEVELHEKYNVSTNPNFYNIVNQTNTKFDTTGFIFINGEKISTKDYKCQNKIKYHSYNKLTVIDSNGNSFQVSKNDPRYLKGELTSIQVGKVMARDKNGKVVKITKEEFENGDYVGTNVGKFSYKNKKGATFMVNINDPRIKSGELVHCTKGLVTAKNLKTGKNETITKYEFENNSNYVGVNSGKIKGENNPNAKTIKIFNNQGKLIITSKGNFKKICKKYGYPLDALSISYKNNGCPIYINKGNRKPENKNLKFKGWYAIKEN